MLSEGRHDVSKDTYVDVWRGRGVNTKQADPNARASDCRHHSYTNSNMICSCQKGSVAREEDIDDKPQGSVRFQLLYLGSPFFIFLQVVSGDFTVFMALFKVPTFSAKQYFVLYVIL
jgi:hypothetical protein